MFCKLEKIYHRAKWIWLIPDKLLKHLQQWRLFADLYRQQLLCSIYKCLFKHKLCQVCFKTWQDIYKTAGREFSWKLLVDELGLVGTGRYNEHHDLSEKRMSKRKTSKEFDIPAQSDTLPMLHKPFHI